MEVKLYQGLLEINWNLLFSAITVLVLYLILKHFFFEKVHNFMEARKAAVQASLDQAEAANEEAQTLLADYRTTLANAETEKRALRYEVAHTLFEKMQADEEKAVVQLKKEVASLAVLTAERIMQKELDENGQQELVDQVLEEAASGKWQNQSYR